MITRLSYIFNKREKLIIVLLFVASIIGSVFECLGVGIFMPFMDVLMDDRAIENTGYLKFFYEKFKFSNTTSFLIALSVCIMLIFVIKNLYLIVEKYFIYDFSYKTQKNISTRLLNAYMNESYTFHINKNISILQRSMQEDVDLFTNAIIHFMELLIEITVCIALGGYLFKISKSITIIVVSLLIICVGIFTVISRKFAKNLGKASQGYKAKILQWMNQGLGGIKEIKVLNREGFFVNAYESYYKKYVKGLKISRLLGILPKYIVEMVSIIGLMLAILLKMMYGQKALVSFIPQLAAFAVAAFRLMPAVGRINEHVTSIMYALPSVELVYNDLAEVNECNCDDGKKANERDIELTDDIHLCDVCYRYPNTDKNVIDKVNITIKKGTTVALIGESGSGKTTLADVILGLLPPNYGKIRINNDDVYSNLGSWHKKIGYIPQNIYLSDDTILNNVAFGIDESDIDLVSVNNAIEKAQLKSLIDNLSDGLNTIVGDRGVRLSGGQRQRIGIARALYHNPEILVLDEATSALDNDTENAVMSAIDSLKGEKTMIIIAHRLSTIRNADVIYEIVDGKAVIRSKEEIFG